MYLRYNNDEHVPLSEATISYDFEKKTTARIFVARPDINESDFDRGETEVFIVERRVSDDTDAIFGGILRDIDRRGSTLELHADSNERLAQDAVPTPGGERWANVQDTTIVNDAIDNVEGLEAGTVENVDSPVTNVFSNASQARKIRTVAETTGAEIVYNPDGTVDYLNRRGSDRTDAVLSPSNRNISGNFTAEKISGDEDYAHLRLVGAGEGAHQVTVNFVPESDPYDYEGDDDFVNVERYEASHWNEDDRVKWEVKSNKDHTSVDSLVRLGTSIMNDVQNDMIKAHTTISNVADVKLGDSFSVFYPEEDVDEEMRIVSLEKQIDSTGIDYNVTLSTRRESLEDRAMEDRKDTQRYNLAFEGNPVNISTGGGRQPVDDSPDKRYEFSFYYPDEVQYEHRVKLNVKRLAYRAYSQGASAGGEHTHSYTDTITGTHAHDIESGEFEHSHPITILNEETELNNEHGRVEEHDAFVGSPGSTDDGFEFVHSFDNLSDYEFAVVHCQATSADGVVEVFAGDIGTFDAYPSDNGIPLWGTSEHNGTGTGTIIVPTNLDSIDMYYNTTNNADPGNLTFQLMTVADHTHDYEIVNESTDPFGDTKTSTTEFESQQGSTTPTNEGGHQHEPEPGLQEFNRFPSDCNVFVNGSDIGVTIFEGGSGTEAIVDLEGDLQQGSWNDIEITSESLGHIQANIDIDVYRQILGDG